MGKSTKRVMQEKRQAFKPLVYICAPYRGNINKNIKDAIRYAKFTYEQGNVPITPHLFFPFLDESKENHRQDALTMDLILLGKCQEVWVFGKRITEGMAKELEVSKRRKQTIRYFTNDYKEITYAANDI